MSLFRVLYRFCLLLFFWVPVAAVYAQSGADIMAKADRMNRPKYEISTMQMDLIDSAGAVVMKRELIWHFRNEENKRASLMKFKAPANVQGVGILVIEEKRSPNAIWHYLPASRNVRRISAAHRQNRFMGSEFIFEDFEGLKLDKYMFTLIGSEPCAEDSECYVVEGQATDKEEGSSSSYGKKVFYVDKRNSTIIKTELFDKDGKLVKIFESKGWRNVGDYWRPQLQTMSNVAEKRVTRLTEVEREIDQPFDRYYIGQQYLRSE